MESKSKKVDRELGLSFEFKKGNRLRTSTEIVKAIIREGNVIMLEFICSKWRGKVAKEEIAFNANT